MIGGKEMFVCLECQRTFEDPECWEEQHSLDYGPYEKWSGCPYCHGPYTEAYRCGCCEEWIDGTYIKLEDGDRICEHCYTIYELGDED